MKKTQPKSRRNVGPRIRVKKAAPVSVKKIADMSPVEIKKIIHELHVHQVELETQNEQLRQAQLEIAEAREKYTDLYDFAPVGYFSFDKKGNIIEANVTGASLLGREKRSLIGKPFRRFITPEHFSIFQSHLQTTLEIQSRQSCRLKLSRKNGKSFDALIDTVAVTDAEGKFNHYRSSVTDITELTRYEEALRVSAESLRRQSEFLEHAPVLVRNLSDEIILWKSGMENMYGYSSDEALGRVSHDLLQTRHPQPLAEITSHILTEGQWRGELRHKSKDGKDVIVTSLQMLHRDVDGNASAIIEVNTDITARKQTEEELGKAYGELEKRVEERTFELKKRTAQVEEANKELESFAYSVSHDLRAPLRAIDGYARMLLKKLGHEFDEDSLRKFNVIRSSSQMMGQLIEDILTLSRLGRAKMSLVDLEMEGIIKDIWKELETINPERNMTLTIQAMPSGYGDRTLIKQVYANLLGNAVKFTRYKNPAQIEAGGYTKGNENVYYVKDNGVGFDMAYYDKLFGIFQRLHNNPDFEGTGVGLATIQRAVHRHGGRVWAEGNVDEGATFYFSLPSTHTHTHTHKMKVLHERGMTALPRLFCHSNLQAVTSVTALPSKLLQRTTDDYSLNKS